MRILESLAPLLSLVVIVAWFAWVFWRLHGAGAALRQGGPTLQIRIAVAALVWVAVSVTAFYLGAQNYFVLGQGASFAALIRFHANWQLGRALLIAGFIPGLSGFLNSLFWPPHSLSETLLLSPAIGAIFGGSLAMGYALFLCGAVSFVWGKAVGYPAPQPQRNGAPFTVETEAPEHVIQIGRAP